MNENRSESRRRVLKAGKIVRGDESVDCTVRNISASGAALEIETPLFTADSFTLIISNDHFERRCRVTWRREKKLGVKFDQLDLGNA